MNEETKIRLSNLEMELVNNTKWIFTKQLIIEKVYQLFGGLHQDYRKIIDQQKTLLPFTIQKQGGKISKGENYKGLPYVILDYPAYFSKEKIFAVRTLFWWGNFFSISFHLSEFYLKKIKSIPESVNFLKEKKFSIAINESQWEHHFQPSNFININKLNKNEIRNLFQKNFLKIAKKTELTEWDSANQFLENVFGEIIEFIKLSFPDGEKDL